MSDHDCRAYCDRARELAYLNGELGALYDALLYCEPCADDDRYVRVPRWALQIGRGFVVKALERATRGKGRHARWLAQRAQLRKDFWLAAGVGKAKREGSSQEAAIAAVAESNAVPEDTVRHACERSKVRGNAVTADTDCPWVAARFQCDVVENPGLWAEAPDCLAGCPCDDSPDDPRK